MNASTLPGGEAPRKVPVPDGNRQPTASFITPDDLPDPAKLAGLARFAAQVSHHPPGLPATTTESTSVVHKKDPGGELVGLFDGFWAWVRLDGCDTFALGRVTGGEVADIVAIVEPAERAGMWTYDVRSPAIHIHQKAGEAKGRAGAQLAAMNLIRVSVEAARRAQR